MATAGRALCDGCDKVRAGVAATDDGRALMCPNCLPIANSAVSIFDLINPDARGEREAEYVDALRRVYQQAAFIADVDVPGHLARAAMAIADRENGEAWDEGYRMNRPHDSQEYRDLINPYR